MRLARPERIETRHWDNGAQPNYEPSFTGRIEVRMAGQRGCLLKMVFLVVLIGVGAAALSLVPLSPLKHSVEVKLSNTLGRSVTVDSVRLNLIGRPQLILTGVTAREDPAFGDGVFLRAQEVRAGFDVTRYLKSRELAIDTIEFKSARVDLIRNPEGVWNWTTVGKRESAESTASRSKRETAFYSTVLWSPPNPTLSASTLREVKFENASVMLRDNGGSAPSELLYKNLALNASLTPQATGDSGHSSQARGTLVARSDEDGEADRLEATLPFDIKIDDRGSPALSISGSIGPGSVETENITIGVLTINGEMSTNTNGPLTGKGQLSAHDFDIHTANISERVARALKLDQIGDMNPGTVVAGFDTEFQIVEGTVHTTGLRIQQLDGLGDATAETGSFKIESSLIVNYSATLVLTPEATSRVKSVSPALGLVVTILETDSRVSVPINITGDVRNPEIQVDVSRIF